MLQWNRWQRSGEQTWYDVYACNTGMGGIKYTSWRYGPIASQDMDWFRWRHSDTEQSSLMYRNTPVPSYPEGEATDESTLMSLGIGIGTTRYFEGGYAVERFEFTLPIWMMLVATAFFPIFSYFRMVIQRQRFHRRRLGYCPCCGEPIQPRSAQCPICDRPFAVVSEV